MKKIIRSSVVIFPVALLILALNLASPVSAAIDIFVTDTIFLTAARDFRQR